MKYITKLKLAAMQQICDHEERSTEYTIQYLQDMVGVSHDCVINYLMLPPHEHVQLISEVNELVSVMVKFEQSRLS